MEKTLELAILRDKLAMQQSTIEYWRGQVAARDDEILRLRSGIEFVVNNPDKVKEAAMNMLASLLEEGKE